MNLICNMNSIISFYYSESLIGAAPINSGTCPLAGSLTGTATWETKSSAENIIDNAKTVISLKITVNAALTGYAPENPAKFTLSSKAVKNVFASNETKGFENPLAETDSESGEGSCKHSQTDASAPYTVTAKITEAVQSSVFGD